MKKTIILGLLGILTACNTTVAQPTEGTTDFYSLSATTLSGDTLDFATLKGKKVIIVNTASKCGFTPQYAQLQELYDSAQAKGEELVILGFPCNQFGKQEPGTSEDIEEFCQLNYGVTFQMMEKVHVKGDSIHPVFNWLTSKELNAVMDYKVQWNFHKFLIDSQGRLIAAYNSRKSPLSKEIKSFVFPE